MKRRREFITMLGGAAAAWPLAARAQQTIRRVGMLLPAAADDAEFRTRVGAFLEGLQQSGWTIGQNVQIDSRWATTNAVEIRRHAAELAALAPDAILASRAFPVGIESEGIPNRCRLGESGEIDSPGELKRCRGRIPRTCVSVRLKRSKAEGRGGR